MNLWGVRSTNSEQEKLISNSRFMYNLSEIISYESKLIMLRNFLTPLPFINISTNTPLDSSPSSNLCSRAKGISGLGLIKRSSMMSLGLLVSDRVLDNEDMGRSIFSPKLVTCVSIRALDLRKIVYSKSSLRLIWCLGHLRLNLSSCPWSPSLN